MSTRPRTGERRVTATNDDSSAGREALLGFLGTDDADVGCARTLELLHVYIDLMLAGRDAENTYPGITAHLRSCGPCIEDFDGLLTAARADRAG